MVTLNVSTKATPLLTAARASGVASLVTVYQGGVLWTYIPLAITPFDYDLGEMYDPQPNSTFTIRKAGFYRVKGFVFWSPPVLPLAGNVAIHYRALVGPIGSQPDSLAYNYMGGLYQRQGYETHVSQGFDDTLVLEIGDTIGLYAQFLTDGSSYPTSIDIGAGYITLQMIAPDTVLAGPTGICNEMAKTTLSAYEKARCVTNPDSCDCPEEEWPLGLALAMGIVVVQAVAAELPPGLAVETDVAYSAGVLSEGAPGLAMTTTVGRGIGAVSDTAPGLALAMDIGTSTAATADTAPGLALETTVVYTPAPAFPIVASFNSTTAASPSTTLTVTAPTGTVAGDLLIGLLLVSNTSAGTTPTGWTIYTSQADGMSTGKLWMWTRVADGTATDSFSPGYSTGGAIGEVLRITGQHASTPINDADQGSTSSSSSPTAPTSTTTVNTCLILRVIGLPGFIGTVTGPGSTTQIESLSLMGPPSLKLQSNREDQATSGNTASRSWSLSLSASTAMFTVAIAPP